MESSILSINRDFYGDLHNMLHVFLGLIHDPDGRYLEGSIIPYHWLSRQKD